ncbi:MAG: hypothetical protein LBL01_00185 [Bifidobacteriaceae bacterium]|jgi:hypothetical protein|nr:hypothetical protein [Bifidobacteriaceae bacterium]
MAQTTGHAKKSVSIPRSLVDAVEQRPGHGTFSAYVAKALQAQLLQDHLEELALELESRHGGPSQAQVDARANELLGQ